MQTINLSMEVAVHQSNVDPTDVVVPAKDISIQEEDNVLKKRAQHKALSDLVIGSNYVSLKKTKTLTKDVAWQSRRSS